ncbi:MAG TPA: hypothetical protein VGO30_04500 [Mycobacterium sp.]|jgi:hypothetical protein|nr:O-methyltransferase involved in polyketide biosynthesis [Mycobacterium sp.]HEV7419087.1 hypothetical protein [Mycobacterium sp.]
MLRNRATEAKRSGRYRMRPMPFELNADESLALAGTIRGVQTARDIPLPAGRGFFKLEFRP